MHLKKCVQSASRQKKKVSEKIMNILATLTEYKSKKAELESMKAELESMKAEITEYVLSKVERDEKGKAVYTCKPFTVTISERKRTGIDEKALKELYPDIAAELETVTVFDRMDIK